MVWLVMIMGGNTGRRAPHVLITVAGRLRRGRLTALQRVVGGFRGRVVWFNPEAGAVEEVWLDQTAIRTDYAMALVG